MDNFIICGMQFGDEGKGTFVDYLAHEHNIDCVARYNGGSQASHTVITPSGVMHKFSQLGSGMFLDKCHTYLMENMVVNLDNLMVEMEVFSEKTGISIPDLMNRIHIHEDCFVVTPYHKLINKLRELSKGSNRRGTVGTGVSEVRYLLTEPKVLTYEPPLGLQVKDIFNPHSSNPIISRMEALQNYVNNFYMENEDILWQNAPDEMKDSLEKEIEFLLSPRAFFRIAIGYIVKFKQQPNDLNFSRCIYNSYELSLRKNCRSAIFEGSQGLLIDGRYGIKPNTTLLDTTNHFAVAISHYTDNNIKIGITKAFASRHGIGIFPTETAEVSDRICDENQEETFWNGRIRFGWFDGVLFRYAQSVNQVDELFLSSIDKLDGFKTIKVCNEYYYNDIPDEKFGEIFSYYTTSNGQIIITDIKKNSEDLGRYLEKCTPKYIVVKGWQQDTSNVSEKSGLPAECLDYISLLEEIMNLHISVISVGPTRENKIRM